MESETSFPENPLQLPLLVEDIEKDFLLPGDRVEGWEMFERRLNGLRAYFSTCGFQHVSFHFKRGWLIIYKEGKGTMQIQCFV